MKNLSFLRDPTCNLSVFSAPSHQGPLRRFGARGIPNSVIIAGTVGAAALIVGTLLIVGALLCRRTQRRHKARPTQPDPKKASAIIATSSKPSSVPVVPTTTEQSRFAEDRQAFAKLLLRVGGDTAKAERLVAFENQRFPLDSRGDLIERAIKRWEQDNRTWR